MRTPKITESQILEGIKAGLNDSQIAKMYGVTQGGISPRCKKLRASLTTQEEPDPEPQGPPRSTVAWKDLRKDMRVLLGKKRFVVNAIDGANNCVLMSMGGSYIPLSREEFEARGYSPLPEGDPQGAPVIEYKLESVTKTEPKHEPKTETVVVKKPESSGQKITEIKMPILTQAEAKEVLKQYDEANLGKEQPGPYESLIMAKAREDVTRFKQIRSEIQKRLDTADHIPIEILNDYEKLIQAAGRQTMKNPCAKCQKPKRYPGCHGHCEDEAAFLEIDLAKRKEARAEREKELAFTEFRIERVEFCKRRAGIE